METNTINIIKLTPTQGMHLKNILTNDIAEGIVYLGKLDSPSNYVEVTEEEYQAFLKQQEEETNKAHDNQE